MHEKIPLTSIEALDAHQAREGLNADTVTAYAQHVIEGGDLPPVIVFKDTGDGVFYLADGFHRVAAYKQAERVTIPAEVRKGSKRDAFKHALGANEEHGLRRTNADRRRAVTLALQDPELGQLGNRAIAKLCKVTHPFVGKVRAVLGKADDSGLDEVDLWEGERDAEAQLARLLACPDLVLVEALWAKGATFETGRFSPADNHRRALRGIAAAKLHADVAGFIEPGRDGQNAAAVARSEALALYDEHDVKGDEIERFTTPQEWAKALQWRVLERDARLVGLIAQRVKVSGGYVECERLLDLVPADAGFRGWVEKKKRAAAQAAQSKDAETSKTAWPWPAQHEGPDALVAWIMDATLDELWKVSKWARYQWNGPDWLRKDDVMISTVWDRFEALGAKTEACQRWDCKGFLVIREDDLAFCQVCNDQLTYRREENVRIVAAARGLLCRGLVTLAELVDGVVTLPVEAPVEARVEADEARIEADEAPVEAPVENYHLSWGPDAEPAKALCGRVQMWAKEFRGNSPIDVTDLWGLWKRWSSGRVVPSPLVRWVPVFDVLGEVLKNPSREGELMQAVEAAQGRAVTPPAVSDTEPPPPIAVENQDLWASAPLARQVIKYLLAWQSSGGTKGLDRATIAAGAWSAQNEAVPADMPSEILAVLKAADSGSDTEIEDALQAACFGGPITLRWINNAEEDEPVKVEPAPILKRRRAKDAASSADVGAAAK